MSARERFSIERLLKDELGHLDLTGRVTKTEKYPHGGGGFGDVWRGRNGAIEVAIKIPKVYQRRGDRDDRPLEVVAKEACREIHVWSRLRHTHVLPLLGFCFDFSSTVSLISPWMINGSAIEFVVKNPDFPAVKLLYGIADGLRYLHENHIVHGDLRGENILISRDATPYLADFGLSRELMKTLSRNPEKIGGSARWMALEYMRGTSAGSTMSGDIWAFGMTTLELVTRKPPFHERPNEPSVILQISSGSHPSHPDSEGVCPGWDESLWELCKACWHPNPTQRPTVLEVTTKVRRFQHIEYSLENAESIGDVRPEENPSSWPVPAFCSELVDLTDKVRATETVYFAGGSFSTIWKGEWVDPADGPPHRLSIKAFLYSHLPESRRMLERRMLRETEAWKRLHHPNVLRFLGVCYNRIGPVHDFPALIAPLCENGNICDYLLRNPHVDRSALIMQIASGLEYLHACQYIHGDLKGSNVLIKDNGKACLCDFGRTKLINEEDVGGFSRSAVGYGNARWSAPELLLPMVEEGVMEDVVGPEPTYASDIWAFGMVVLEVLTNKVPWYYFRDVAIFFWLTRRCTPSRDRYREIPDGVWECLKGCWDYDPSGRPSISGLVQQQCGLPESNKGSI